MSIPHSDSHHKHRKNGCSTDKAVLSSSQTRAHRRVLTEQQKLSPIPIWMKPLRLLPDIVSRQHHVYSTKTASPDSIQGTQLDVYTIVRDHFATNSPNRLWLIIMGTAGTGNSFLIQCLRILLGDSMKLLPPLV